jgi:hypothetical protein
MRPPPPLPLGGRRTTTPPRRVQQATGRGRAPLSSPGDDGGRCMNNPAAARRRQNSSGAEGGLARVPVLARVVGPPAPAGGGGATSGGSGLKRNAQAITPPRRAGAETPAGGRAKTPPRRACPGQTTPPVSPRAPGVAATNGGACRILSFWSTGAVWMIMLGVLIAQVGWWTLYGDICLLGGVIGTTLALLGGVWLNGGLRWDGTSPQWLFLVFLFLAACTTIYTADNGPRRGTVPVAFVVTTGRSKGRVASRWVDQETAETIQAETMGMSTPNCTNTCKEQSSCDEFGCWSTSGSSDGVCDDGGRGSRGEGDDYRLYMADARSAVTDHFHGWCPLGSDTADCGCRSGDKIIEWLPPRQYNEFDWVERAGYARCALWAGVLGTAGLLALVCSLMLAKNPFIFSRRQPVRRGPLTAPQPPGISLRP